MFYYSLVVLCGAISYGLLSTFVKLSYDAGISPNEVLVGQFVIGWTLFLLIFFSQRPKRRPRKTVLSLMVVGTTISSTGIFYYLSLQTLPASIAIILLFQFTWIGIIIECIATSKLPTRKTVIAVLILLVGTVFAAGVTGTEIQHLTPMGVTLGFCAAISFSLFIFFSGKVAIFIPSVERSFYMICGALLVTLLVFPNTLFTIDGVSTTWLWYSLALGFFGIVLPTFLFAIGMPKLERGLGPIISSAELPTVVVMSILVLQESVSYWQWLGILFILLGIGYSQIPSNQIVNAKST
ncbi:EamA family transporter [Bacillus alkalicellulosilyticus]|uniref:EamA family transporter n=1 Tax=Alkalihalobacterium alkalicellulosilyticum TaxID=1912214 RepID=UPI000998DAE3|nr:EamA family transporter [Bacillus alkalicellulosilyticus]